MRLKWTVTVLLLGQFQLPSQVTAQYGLVLAKDNLTYPYPVGDGKMHWSGNQLAGCDFCVGDHPVVWSVSREGIRKSVSLDISGAGYIAVHDVAAGPDGSLSAVGMAISADSRISTFIAWISPDRDRQVLTQTWPYSPNVLVVTSDGSIWTVGEMNNDNKRVVTPNLLRHYSQSGQLLASSAIRHVEKNSGGLYNVSGISTLMASNDRIGWLTETCQYIEFSLDGAQTGNYTCPNGIRNFIKIAGIALSSADDVLIEPAWFEPLAPLQLNRATGTWSPVKVLKDAGVTHMILGFDGTTLVSSAATPQGSSMRRYEWLGTSSSSAVQ